MIKKRGSANGTAIPDLTESLESELRFQPHGTGAYARVVRIPEIGRCRIRGILHVEHVHIEPIGLICVVEDVERVSAQLERALLTGVRYVEATNYARVPGDDSRFVVAVALHAADPGLNKPVDL